MGRELTSTIRRRGIDGQHFVPDNYYTGICFRARQLLYGHL
jgi:hypothetical protein